MATDNSTMNAKIRRERTLMSFPHRQPVENWHLDSGEIMNALNNPIWCSSLIAQEAVDIVCNLRVGEALDENEQNALLLKLMMLRDFMLDVSEMLEDLDCETALSRNVSSMPVDNPS